MNPPPRDWPRISASLVYADPKKAIAWLCEAFAFEVRILVEGEDGSVHHSELTYGEGLVMISGEKLDKYPNRRAPTSVGGANTTSLFAYVDDIEAHIARSRAAGAEIIQELATNDYGEAYWTDRTYGCRDPGGHHWWFSQRLRTGST